MGVPLTLKRWLLSMLLGLKKTVRDRRLRRYRQSLDRPLYGPRVLIVSNDGIGNAVEATPLVQAIKMLWTRAHVTFLVPSGDLFADWSLVDRVTNDVDSLVGEVFDHTFMTMAYSLPPGGLPCRSGQVHRAAGRLPAWQTRAERESVIKMARRLGFRGLSPPLYVSLLPPPAALPDAARRICIVPGGKPAPRWRHKRWPHYGQLVRRLLERYDGCQVVVIGGPTDELSADFPVGPAVVDLRGALTLRQTSWVLKHSDLVIGNDCGPMHIADAVQTPALVLFGMTCELKNGPTYRAAPLSIDVACSPCQYTPATRDACIAPRCLNDLSVDLVMRSAETVLAASDSAAATE